MPGLGIALTLASLGASAFGMAKSAQANNALRAKLLERSNSLNDVFTKDMSMNYMETPGVKNLIASYSQGLKDINKNVEGRAAMSGASPEAVIGEREKVNQNYGDFLRKVGAGQDQYRQDKERMYNIRRDNMDNMIYASDAQQASQWDNFVKNAAGLGVAGISADAIQEPGSGKAGDWLNNLFKKNKIAGDIAGNPGSSMNLKLKKNLQFQKN